MALLGKKKNQPEDGQMELIEHLAELRSRLVRSILYIVGSMAITYNFFDKISAILRYPIEPIMSQLRNSGAAASGFNVFGIQAGFFLWLQVSFISALVLAMPLITLELWGFIRPALTPEEQKPVRMLAPFSVLLFLAGIGTGYAALPQAYGWMAGYIRDLGAGLVQNEQDYILLTCKILLAFGLSFELPVLLLFLGRIGVITSTLMTTYWRHAVVLIVTLAAIFTPTNDPLTMLMMAIPMAALYLLSISLVRAFEPRPDGSASRPVGTVILVALAPVAILSAVGYWLWRNNPIAKVNRPHTPAAIQAQNATLTPEMEKRIKALEDGIKAQQEALDTLRTQLAATPTPAPTAAPLGTPEPLPTPDPDTLQKKSGRTP